VAAGLVAASRFSSLSGAFACDSKEAYQPGWPSCRRALFCPKKAWGYTRSMLWVKSFHIVFIASWFAGLFYLPRIFVNLAMVPPESVAERARLMLMARKLLRFTTLLAVPALATGLWLYLWYGIGLGPGNGWMHAKLAVVALVIGYHHACGRVLTTFADNRNQRSHVWFRWFNEAPVILMLIVVILVVVKPF
jgi:putative membrane protein